MTLTAWANAVAVDEILNSATNPDFRCGSPLSILESRVLDHMSRLTLADTNAAFAYAKRNPHAIDMWKLNRFKDSFDALIDLSDGMLSWANNEDASEISLPGLLQISELLKCEEDKKRFIDIVELLFYPAGRRECGWPHPYCWLTADAYAGTIKPAKR